MYSISIRFIIIAYIFLSISLSIATQDLHRIWMRKSKLHTKNSWICLHTRNNLNTYINVWRKRNEYFFTSLWASNYDCVHFRESFIMHLLHALSLFKMKKKRGISVFPVVLHFKYSFISFISTSHCNRYKFKWISSEFPFLHAV